MAALVPGEKARMYALGGVARGGATRGGYLSGAACIAIGGVHLGFGRADASVGVLIPSLSIRDELDEAPNTCRFRVHGTVPAAFAEVVVTLGTKNRLERQFGGVLLTVNQRYAANNPRFVQADCAAVDYTWQLGFHKVTAQYRGVSVTAIVRELVATYAAADGFTAAGVAEGLPALEEVTFTNEDLPDALTRVARRIGAYWYVDYHKVIHFFFSEVRNGAPADLVPAHPSFRRFTRSGASTQALSRVYVEGRGTNIIGATPAGSTVIPVETVEMFAPPAADVFLKASFQGSDGGAQHLSYTGVDAGGGGSLVGPGAAVGGAPAVALTPGAGIEAGAHGYAYTWVTAAGETAPGPVATVIHGTVPGPAAAPVFGYSQPIGGATASDPYFPGDQVRYCQTYGLADEYGPNGGSYLANGLHTPAGPVLTVTAVADPSAPGYAQAITFSAVVPADARVQTVYIWRSVNGGPWRGVMRQSNAYMAGWGSWPINNEKLPDYLTTGTALPAPANNLNQTAIAGIAVGPAAVTARKIYRTAAGGAQLKLLQTIANNTATAGATDTAADGSLGANAPAGDTSGLAQPAGQVNPGAASIIVATAAPFRPGGGWAVIGNGEQVIRYTGLSGNTLTGVPASGPGAITATVVYNSTITAAPLLTGIPASGARSLTRALTAGDQLYLVVQVEETGRQTTLAGKVGGPGVREEWVQDRRLSMTEARLRGQATLAARPLEAVGVTYQCRDLRTSSGKDITVNLPAPTNVHGTYKIQAVTIDNFRPRPAQLPTFTVEAAALRFSFEEWLRLIQPRE